MEKGDSFHHYRQGKRGPRTPWRTLFMLFILSSLTACATPGYYSLTREVTGHVVDGATGVPLEGVIVVGSWPGIGSTHCGDHEAMRSHLHETTTDSNGVFRIPGCLQATGVFFHSDAYISFYKKGYFPKRSKNDPLWKVSIGKGRLGYIGPGWVWQFQGSVIELESSAGISQTMLNEILKSKNIYVVSEYDSVPFKDCYWMKMPRMTMAIGHRKREKKDTPEMQRKPLAEYLVDHWFEKPEQCHPDPVGFLREYKDYED
ncbi:MAG: carboxypeptidase-like regulatory domain-containing protein [Candidatus Thiodiazotropha sp.]